MKSVLLASCALVLVFEGLLPFAAPALWRKAVLRIAALADGQIRFLGLSAIVVGLVCLILFV